jgi:hypothetical protein
VLTLLAGAVWYAAVIKWIMPEMLRDGEPLRHFYRYSHLLGAAGGLAGEGGGVGTILKGLLLHPFEALEKVADAPRVFSAMLLFLPVALLPLRRPQTLIVCAPAVGANLLSNWSIQHTLDLHYAIAILPWVYVASVMAVWPDAGIWPDRRIGRGAAIRVGAFVLIASVMMTVFFGRSPIGKEYSPTRYQRLTRHEQAREAIEAIPRDAAVSANTNLGAHLTRRRDIFQFPTIENAERIILDIHESNDPRKSAATFPLSREDYFTSVTTLRASPEWRVEREWPGDYIIFARESANQVPPAD